MAQQSENCKDSKIKTIQNSGYSKQTTINFKMLTDTTKGNNMLKYVLKYGKKSALFSVGLFSFPSVGNACPPIAFPSMEDIRIQGSHEEGVLNPWYVSGDDTDSVVLTLSNANGNFWPDYDETLPIYANFDYFGVLATSVVSVNDTSVTLNITPCEANYAPQIIEGFGVVDSDGLITASATSPEEILNNFRTFLESGGFGALALADAVGQSVMDPIAGNPTSLLYNMGSASSNLAAYASETLDDQASGVAQPASIGLDPSYSQSSAQGVDFTALHLPIQYLKPFGKNLAFLADTQASYTTTSGQKSYMGTVGAGLSYGVVTKPNFKWTILPMVRAGLVDAPDIGSKASLVSSSISSALNTRLHGVKIELANTLSTYKSTSIETKAQITESSLTTSSLQTALRFEGDLPFKFQRRTLVWDGEVSNTRFDGDALFIDTLTEYTFNIGTRRIREGSNYSAYRLGVSYLSGNNDYNGFRLNFGYSF